ncbi:MAG: hypothetical protein NTX82_04835 [Candidatus Parcubacteria bacterium]|nr:hypothetical protein [Candidatus Parcubacteria bacterium]
MTKVKKIGVLSCAKIEGLIGVVAGLVGGIIFFLVGSALQSIFQSADFESSGMMFGSAMSIVILPIIYGVVGFIGGAIVALLYNLIAGWIGGIEIELENK